MGTMLQAADLTLDAFLGLEGCNEILTVSRPDLIAGVHAAFLAVGADQVDGHQAAEAAHAGAGTAGGRHALATGHRAAAGLTQQPSLEHRGHRGGGRREVDPGPDPVPVRHAFGDQELPSRSAARIPA